MAASRRSSSRISDPNLTSRVITAVIGIALILAIIMRGGTVLFALIVCLAAILCGWEAYRMLLHRGHRPALLLGLVLATCLAWSPRLANPYRSWQILVLVGAMLMGLWFLFSNRPKEAFLDWAFTLAVAVYIGMIGNLTAIRDLHHGVRLVLLTLVLTWAYDTGAYFSGQMWGRTPFMQHISSSKTVEGVGGGVVLTLIVSLVAAHFVHIDFLTAGTLAIAVAAAAQIGDLVESLMKRYCDVKDSGSMIPGHGGILDRVDSLLFTSTAAFYVFLAAGYH